MSADLFLPDPPSGVWTAEAGAEYSEDSRPGENFRFVSVERMTVADERILGGPGKDSGNKPQAVAR
jgi:hypothetical protein